MSWYNVSHNGIKFWKTLDCLDLLAYVKRKIFFRTFIFYFHHGFPENSLGLVLPWLMVFDRFLGDCTNS